MRHRLANLFYRLGRRWDRAVPYGGDSSQFGDHASYDRTLSTSVGVSIHAMDGTPVRGSFQPGRFTYAAVTIGQTAEMTIFVSRRTTRKLLTVLGQIEAGYAKYGEGERS